MLKPCVILGNRNMGILSSEKDENKLSQSNGVLNSKSHLSYRNLAGDLESSLICMKICVNTIGQEVANGR